MDCSVSDPHPYEGIDLGGERVGLITYMRTDSTALSKEALGEMRRTIRRAFGGRYLPAKPRVYRSRVRNVREAHEAIRPTTDAPAPDGLAGRLEGDAARLYTLIRDRALASQMASARIERVEIAFASASHGIALAATGRLTAFDGFLRLYRDDAGEPEPPDDRALPALEAGEAVEVRGVLTMRRETASPPRYTEAGLVHRLEALGIGRPSTYAAIVGVLQDRGYVALTGGRFVPLERGRVVTAFLECFFGPWVEYGFTAGLEADLDRIAGGGLAWKGMLGGFWDGFHAVLEEVGACERSSVLARVETALAQFIYGPGDDAERRRCPDCREGGLVVKASRYGLFVGCDDWPACGYRRPLAASEARAHEGPRALDSVGERPRGGRPGLCRNPGLGITALMPSRW